MHYTLNMRIGEALTPNHWQMPLHFYNPMQQVQQPEAGKNSFAEGGVIVDISPESFAASRAMAMEGPAKCSTCEARRYQDVSDDSSVSFQTPTHISPGQSAARVASHEAEHVSNERARAEEEGREIISQTVSLSTSICPECKTVYVSGGETRTISAAAKKPAAMEAEAQDA